MAGTVSKTTKITQATLPADLQAVADRVIAFARANGITEPPITAVFDRKKNSPEQYHLVWKQVTDGEPDHFGMSLNVLAEAPNTVDGDMLDLRTFLGFLPGPLAVVWQSFISPPTPPTVVTLPGGATVHLPPSGPGPDSPIGGRLLMTGCYSDVGGGRSAGAIWTEKDGSRYELIAPDGDMFNRYWRKLS